MTHSRRKFLTMLGIATGTGAVTNLEEGLAGPVLQSIEAAPPATPLLEPLAADDPTTTALSRLLTQLTDANPRIRTAAVETFGGVDDVGAVDTIGRILADADRREAVDYALAWIAGER